MQRRQFLKWFLPLTLLPVGVVIGHKLLFVTSCHLQSVADLLAQLKPFSDVVLGKKITVQFSVDDLKRFDTLCEDNFAASYRQLIANDFAASKTANVDGWILSETELLTHRAVYLSNVPLSVGSKP